MSQRRLLRDPAFKYYRHMNSDTVEDEQAHDTKLESLVFKDDGVFFFFCGVVTRLVLSPHACSLFWLCLMFPAFVNTTDRIRQGIDIAFVEAEKYKRTFEKPLEIYIQNEHTNIRQMYAKAPPAKFAEAFKLYREQQAQFAQIVEKSTVGTYAECQALLVLREVFHASCLFCVSCTHRHSRCRYHSAQAHADPVSQALHR